MRSELRWGVGVGSALKEILRRQFEVKFRWLSRQQDPVKVRGEMGPQGSIHRFTAKFGKPRRRPIVFR